MSSRDRSDADHLWHVWLNRWNKPNQFDHSMYEFKSMLQFLQYGARQLEQAFTETLPATHRQCSHSGVEPIENNTLTCAFGTDVTKCEILASIRDTFSTERYRYPVPDQEMYRVMANTCAWHMYTDPVRTGQLLDTSEGWLTDTSDRLYWSRVYASLGQSAEHGAENDEIL